MKGHKIQELGDLLAQVSINPEIDESAVEELARIADGDDSFELSADIINEEEEEKDYDDGE